MGNNFLDTLLTTQEVFVSPETAEVYGIMPSGSPSAGPISLSPSERYGVFTQPSWVLSHSKPEETNVVGRGLFFRTRVLCGEIPPIPVGVIPIVPEDPNRTMRERLSLHFEDNTCANCHRLMDPLGLSLEGFDHLGRRRYEELGRPVDTTGRSLVAEMPLALCVIMSISWIGFPSRPRCSTVSCRTPLPIGWACQSDRH